MILNRIGLWARTVASMLAVLATVPMLVGVWLIDRSMKVFMSWRGLVIIGVLALLTSAYGGYWLFGSRGHAEGPLDIEVRSGTSFRSFTDTLVSRGIISHPLMFRIVARLSGIDRNLHVGLYRLSPADSPFRLLGRMARHEQIFLKFTAIEGAVLRELVPDVADQLDISEESLWAAVNQLDLRSELGLPADLIEGYLFPETYMMPWGASAEMVVMAMRSQFDTVWNRLRAEFNPTLSLHETVTLASMIEAEATVSEERRRISSVFHNRLKRRMKLQCDPTVIYAMGGLDRPLNRKDWKYDSPYNTYRVFGLPPGPICNPGEAALRAALNPDETDDLYFMARGDGTHIFSRTLAEHEAAYRAVKRAARR